MTMDDAPIPVRRTVIDGEVWVNARDLVHWMDQSLLRNVDPEGSAIKLEFAAALGGLSQTD